MRQSIFPLAFIILIIAGLASCTNHKEFRVTPRTTSASTVTPTLNPTATSTVTASATLQATRTRHPTATQDISPKEFFTIGKGLLKDIAYSEGGKMAAYVEGKRLSWLDRSTGEEIGALELDDVWLGDLTFSPDGNWIIFDTGFSIWVVNTATQTYTRCCGGGSGPSFGFTFSEDSRYLAYTSADGTTGGPYHFVSVYELETDSYLETEVDRLRKTQSAADDYSYWDWNQSYPVKNPRNYHTMSAPAISTDSQWLSAGYHDTSNDILYAWHLETGETRLEIPHPAEINSVDISPDGQYLVSGCDDGLVRLFNLHNGKLEKKIAGFMDRITRVQFSADNHQLTISVADHPDLIYDLNTDQLAPSTPVIDPDPFLISLHQQGYADGSGVLFSPDGQTIAIGRQSIQLWDIDSREVITSLENPYNLLLGWTFSPEGTHLAGVTLDGEILVWEIASSQLVLIFKTQMLEPGQVFFASGYTGIGPGIGAGVFTGQGIAFSPDGTNIAFGNGNAIEIWNITETNQIATLTQPQAPAYATRVSFSSDGERLYALINRNQDAQIWDIRTQKLIKQLHLPDVTQMLLVLPI